MVCVCFSVCLLVSFVLKCLQCQGYIAFGCIWFHFIKKIGVLRREGIVSFTQYECANQPARDFFPYRGESHQIISETAEGFQGAGFEIWAQCFDSTGVARFPVFRIVAQAVPSKDAKEKTCQERSADG